MIHLAKIITRGALLRDECRGAHYKPEFDLRQPEDFDPHEYINYIEKKHYGEPHESDYPHKHFAYMQRFEKNNEKWLKTTIAQHRNNEPDITYEEIDASLITPRPRKYD